MKHLKLLLITLFACLSVSLHAQTAGDKLFAEGKQLQNKMTIASQEAAIKKFTAAKIVYDAAAKKGSCDKHISQCKQNIKKLKASQAVAKKQTKTPKKEESKRKKQEAELEAYEPEVIIVEKPVIVERKAVALAARPGSLLFKWNPKGISQSIEVNCNYDDWQIIEQPKWIVTTISADRRKIIVQADVNIVNTPRYGNIKIKCGNKLATIIVEQKKGKKKIM